MPDAIGWVFYGYRAASGGGVQEWYDDQPDAVRNEIADVVGYLQHRPTTQWRRPEFDSVGGGLSELRFKVNELKQVVRIYGFFYPRRFCYSFLLGGVKKGSAQRDIAEARRRKLAVEQRRAGVAEFKFSSEPHG